MTSPQEVKPSHVTVWGIAAGKGTTAEAAPGAFTVRTYKLDELKKAEADWKYIVRVSAQERGA